MDSTLKWLYRVLGKNKGYIIALVAIQAVTGSIGSAGRGVGGCLHAEETSQTREETACQEGKRHPGVLYVQSVCHEGKQRAKHDKHNAYDLVLLFQVGHSTFSHVEGNLLHAGRSLVFLHHLGEEKPSHAQSYNRSNGHEPEYTRNVHIKLG